MKLKDVTVVILTKNEEHAIKQCIASVPFAAEVLVVDSGSTDRTCEIAATLGARVVSEPWPGSFAAQRNAGDTHVRTDWVLQIDADETVSEELAAQITDFFATGQDAQYTAARFPRRELVFGKWIGHGGWYPQQKLRLYRKGAGAWAGSVHENYTGFPGVPYTFTGDLLHDSYRSVEVFLAKFNRYSSIDAQEAFLAGQRFSLVKLFFQPLERFMGRYLGHKGYRDGMHGLALALLVGLNYFMRQLKLWELWFRHGADSGASGKTVR